jgi:hypothetical protein
MYFTESTDWESIWPSFIAYNALHDHKKKKACHFFLSKEDNVS